MNTQDVIYQLRTKNGLSQDELAERVFVTRQAVSRWENGETVPNTETLKLLSRLFNVSINTLLGSPHTLYCQCCGMPLEDAILGRDRDGALNEAYCKWCYSDGTYVYTDMDDLIDACAGHMVSESFTEEQARAYMKQALPKLDYWKQYRALGGEDKLAEFREKVLEEINALSVEGLPRAEKLESVPASQVNPEFRLPSGKTVRFLNDGETCLSARLPSEFGGDRCFTVAAGLSFILIWTCAPDGSAPELVLYRQR